MMKDFKIQRFITYYEKFGDGFIGEKILLEEEFSLNELKAIFGNYEKDPLLYEQYKIDKNISSLINDKIDFVFDFDKYDYFLETFSVFSDSEKEKGVRHKDH
ncbi:hypothetical protein LS482_08565 [Sinomicrobium kalidii]|uniref:DUF7683 domain-containing protein n=1 Tax=Sinomicrobium kalidii TaxID=2900738 RepID=UPI001E60C4F1|nr:hypothetical protein [Sinomicrobium kalidii]UGU17919.1 hypothetical protein LS482_08565 [Sinomicrobium kalidii]